MSFSVIPTHTTISSISTLKRTSSGRLKYRRYALRRQISSAARRLCLTDKPQVVLQLAITDLSTPLHEKWLNRPPFDTGSPSVSSERQKPSSASSAVGNATCTSATHL